MGVPRLIAPLIALAPLALLACDAGGPDTEGGAGQGVGRPIVLPPASPPRLELTPAQQARLEANSCREFVEAYSTALERSAFAYAAEFWDDPVIDGERLAALFDPYVSPTISINRIWDYQDPLACTVTGAVLDVSDPRTVPQPGEIELRRAAGEDGPQRWRIHSSTFLEPMQRAGRGEPS